MSPTAFVFDRSRETALARAQLVRRALDAAQAHTWTVEAVTSRNRLLADVARCQRQPRSLALVDLADNERNIDAYEIADNAASLGFVGHANGSGYVPVPGDMIAESPTPSNSAGHVAVVDRSDATMCTPSSRTPPRPADTSTP